MLLETWLLYVITVFFISATPGPNMLLVMTASMKGGWRYSVPTMLGLLFALAGIMAASALGLGALLNTSYFWFSVVKWVGAAYLIYLGIKSFLTKVSDETDANTTSQTFAKESRLTRFRHGCLVALSNPKAYLFFTALFPQFLGQEAIQTHQFLILGVTFFMIESFWQWLYALGGQALQIWMKHPRHQRWLNRFAGLAFIVAGLWLSQSSQHTTPNV